LGALLGEKRLQVAAMPAGGEQTTGRRFLAAVAVSLHFSAVVGFERSFARRRRCDTLSVLDIPGKAGWF